jgi:hypothetical protein
MAGNDVKSAAYLILKTISTNNNQILLGESYNFSFPKKEENLSMYFLMGLFLSFFPLKKDDPICVMARDNGKIVVTEAWVDDTLDLGVRADETKVIILVVAVRV